jgi:hypothetical protein
VHIGIRSIAINVWQQRRKMVAASFMQLLSPHISGTTCPACCALIRCKLTSMAGSTPSRMCPACTDGSGAVHRNTHDNVHGAKFAGEPSQHLGLDRQGPLRDHWRAAVDAVPVVGGAQPPLSSLQLRLSLVAAKVGSCRLITDVHRVSTLHSRPVPVKLLSWANLIVRRDCSTSRALCWQHVTTLGS